MPKSKTAQRAERLRQQGFDMARVSYTGCVHVACSQCEALVINGVACHETGCPNTPRPPRYSNTGEGPDD